MHSRRQAMILVKHGLTELHTLVYPLQTDTSVLLPHEHQIGFNDQYIMSAVHHYNYISADCEVRPSIVRA